MRKGPDPGERCRVNGDPQVRPLRARPASVFRRGIRPVRGPSEHRIPPTESSMPGMVQTGNLHAGPMR